MCKNRRQATLTTEVLSGLGEKADDERKELRTGSTAEGVSV
jgi:hypothetical protein